MKRFLLSFLCLMSALLASAAQDMSIYRLVPGKVYYVYNSLFGRALGVNQDASQPKLYAYDKSRDTEFQWVAEASQTTGYVLLKNLKTCKYLHASSSNSYSVDLQAASGTDARYEWLCCPSGDGFLRTRHNTSTFLGLDQADESKEEVSVWYDKDESTGRTWQLFEVLPSAAEAADPLQTSRRAWVKLQLSNFLDYITEEQKNTKNNTTLCQKTFDEATSVYTNEALTTDSVLNYCMTTLASRISSMCAPEAQILLTEADMTSVGNTFTLAMNPVSMAATATGDSARIVLRSPSLLGAEMILKNDGIRSLDTTVPLDLTTATSVVLVYQNAEIHIYVDGEKKGSLPTYFAPSRTSQQFAPEWSVLRKSRLGVNIPEVVSETKAVTTVSAEGTIDKYGKRTRTLISLSGQTLTFDKQMDLHLVASTSALKSCTINLNHEDAWVIFDNIRPSDLRNSGNLSQIRINGARATEGTNCRIAIYLAGSAVIPLPKAKPFIGYDGEMATGDSFQLGVGKHGNLGKNSNRAHSFTLKRGYMAVLASDADGKGYSRVYVADHQDIKVDVLPNALYGRISSVTVREWQYVSKKGYCSTQGDKVGQAKKVGATWYYTWSADGYSTSDVEYIPIRQHKYWPSMSAISKHDVSATLSINEPDHSEQHNNCDCGGTMSPWQCCEITPDFQQTGMRIGGPAPTSESWNKDYIDNCNNMAYRCDFIAIHCYWGSNEAANPDAWYNKLKAIYDQTKRPIWITEWAYGATWTKEWWPDKWGDKVNYNRDRIREIMKKLEEAPFVERYAYYQWDTDFRGLMYDWGQGGVTPAGRVYRDMKSTFAYNKDVQFTPVWWTPSLKSVSMKAVINDIDETLAVTVTNENKDLTDKMVIQYCADLSTGTWTNYYEETDRSKFDDKTIEYSFPLADFDLEKGALRLYVHRRQNDESYSATASLGYLENPGITANSKTDIPGWKCTRSAANGYTKADKGDTYFEVWDEKPAGMEFNYYQDVTGLPEGIYEFSGSVFHSTNDIAGATVNGSVGLYAQTDTMMWFAPVTQDCKMDNAQKLTLSTIAVREGQSLRVGIRNLGVMTARWAGGDNFSLRYVGPLTPQSSDEALIASHESLVAMMGEIETEQPTTKDATCFIVNPDCTRKGTYGWTDLSNIETDAAEPYDGNKNNNPYWNIWKSGGYTSKMSQTITGLPDGEYSLSALMRGSAILNADITMTVISTDTERSASVTGHFASPSGSESPAGSPYLSGWQEVQTDKLLLRHGDKLKIEMKSQLPSTGWWSADRFKLTWRHVDIVTGITEIDAPDTDTAADTPAYSLTGQRISGNAKGIRITGGRKILK